MICAKNNRVDDPTCSIRCMWANLSYTWSQDFGSMTNYYAVFNRRISMNKRNKFQKLECVALSKKTYICVYVIRVKIDSLHCSIFTNG